MAIQTSSARNQQKIWSRVFNSMKLDHHTEEEEEKLNRVQTRRDRMSDMPICRPICRSDTWDDINMAVLCKINISMASLNKSLRLCLVSKLHF